MAQTRNIKTDEFDSLIIGGGLTGLLAAHQLDSTGRRVALVESMDMLGGSCRMTNSKVGPTDLNFKFFPDSPETHQALEWLSSVLGQKIDFEIIEAPPLTYEDGRFKPFVGFGDQKVETASEIDAYAKSRYLRLSTTPKDWVKRLTETFTGTVFTQSQATKMQIDDQFVIEVMINGAKRLSGREVLFCAAPQQLIRLLPEANSPARLRQRLLKGEFWTSVNLDLVHAGQVTDSQSVHALKGANEEPCVGIFSPAVILEDGRQAQLSQWITFVARDMADDPELVGAALKQIKRQLKRAYETSLNGLIQERIVVSPLSHGDFTGVLTADGKWPKLQNLWAVSGLQDNAKNTIGSVRQVRRTLQSIMGDILEGTVLESDEYSEGPQPTA